MKKTRISTSTDHHEYQLTFDITNPFDVATYTSNSVMTATQAKNILLNFFIRFYCEVARPRNDWVILSIAHTHVLVRLGEEEKGPFLVGE